MTEVVQCTQPPNSQRIADLLIAQTLIIIYCVILVQTRQQYSALPMRVRNLLDNTECPSEIYTGRNFLC